MSLLRLPQLRNAKRETLSPAVLHQGYSRRLWLLLFSPFLTLLKFGRSSPAGGLGLLCEDKAWARALGDEGTFILTDRTGDQASGEAANPREPRGTMGLENEHGIACCHC